MNRIKNKTALITGATSGIGRACALELAKAGVHLILQGRDAAKLKALETALVHHDISIETLCFDVREEANVTAALSNVRVDILINNAGLALGLAPLDSSKLAHFNEMIDTNIKGVLYVTQPIMAVMRQNNSGHIINIGSIAGRMTYPNGSVYCATKAALHSLSEAMNIDAFGTNIRVSNIAPGAVETNFSTTRFEGDTKKADAVYEGYTPLSAEDIAQLVHYILNAPEHVNIQDTLIMPTAQRNPYMLHKQ